jgi:hypothetical protein
MVGTGRTIVPHGLRAIFISALSVVVLAGCGEDTTESGIRPAARSEVKSPPPPEGNPGIQSPTLPDCLDSEDAEGCAAPPALPSCLSEGCASPPVMNDWTCPADWHTESITLPTDDVLTICAAPEPAICPTSEAAFVGQTTCSAIGPACPASPFPSEDALQAAADGFAGSILYVAPGGSGDGSLAAPFGSLGEALQHASDGDIVVLGAGSFPENIDVDRRVAVIGHCVANTTLSPSDPTSPTVRLSADGALISGIRILGAQSGVTIDGASDSRLEDVEILGAAKAAVQVDAGGEVALERVVLRPTDGPLGSPAEGMGLVVLEGHAALTDVVIERSRNAGVFVDGASSSAEARRAIIANTLPRLQDDESGVGVAVLADASASLAETLINRNRGAGLLVEGAILSVSDVSVRETRGLESDARGGHGIMALAGAQVSATRILIDRNRTSGVLASGAGTLVQLQSVAVRDTERQESDDTAGRGLEAWSGAHLIAHEAWVNHNRAMGLVAIQPGSTLEIFDSFVTETEYEEASGYFGRGFWVTGAATGSATRTWFVDNRSIGAGAVKTGSALELTDVEIRGTRPRQLDDDYGRGIEVWGGASLHAVRTSLRANRSAGLFSSDPGTQVSLEQVLIEGTLPRLSDSTGGYGLVAWAGVAVEVRQSLLNENHAVGIYVADPGTAVTMQDVSVRATKAEVDDEAWGAGWIFSEGCVASGERIDAIENRTVGFLATDPGTVATLQDVTARDTKEPAGYDSLAPGYGMAAMAGAKLSVTRATLLRNGTAGMVIGEDATLEAEELLVRETRSDAENHAGGEGLVATAGSSIVVRRSAFVANRSTAVAAYGLGATAKLEDMIFRDTEAPACADLPIDDPDVCAVQGETWAPSAGLWADGGASVVVTRFESSGASCGLWAGPDGWLNATHGTIHHNAVGANVRNVGLDIDLVRGPTLRYIDNDTNLDDVEMDVPDVSGLVFPDNL